MNLAQPLTAARPGTFGLWPSVGKLLLLRARIWWNSFKRAKMRSKIGTIVILLLILGFMVFLFIGSSALLRLMLSPELAEYVDPAQFTQAIPTLVLTMAFFLTLMTNFGVLLQALYLSHDMDFLVTAPLPMRAVFLAKLLEAVLPNFALFCAVSLPVLFGMGLGSGYTLLYYPALIALLVMLALAASGLAAILVMAVVRVVPARRVAEVLGVVGALVSVLCGQTGNIINAMNVDQSDVGSALGVLSSLDTPWSPLAWAGRGVTALGQADWLPGLALTLLSLLLAGAVFAGALQLSEQLYYSGWASMQGNGRKKKKVRAAAAQPIKAAPVVGSSPTAQAVLTPTLNTGLAPASARPNLLARLFPAPLRGLVRKDFLVLRRDPRNLSNLITPLILGFVMLFTTQNNQRGAGRALDEFGVSDFGAYGLVLLALLVGWMLMMNLGTLAFSREGKNYWLLKTAPLGPWLLLGSKFVVTYLPSAAVSLGYLLIAWLIRGQSGSELPFAALSVALIMAGGAGITLAYGAAGAKLDWDSPQRQKLSGSMGCLSFIVASLYMLLAAGLFLAPPALWQVFAEEVALFRSAPVLGYGIGLLLGGALSLAAAIVPLLLVVPRLARIGEAG